MIEQITIQVEDDTDDDVYYAPGTGPAATFHDETRWVISGIIEDIRSEAREGIASTGLTYVIDGTEVYSPGPRRLMTATHDAYTVDSTIEVTCREQRDGFYVI